MTERNKGVDVGAIPAGGQPHAGVARPIETEPVTVGGARVYLHSLARRRYLATVVAAQAEGLAAMGAGHVHVATGWRFGPHFDLRADADRQRPIDWEAIAAALADGAHDHPARVEVSEDDYLRTANQLGQIEAVPPPYLPRRPHGHTELLTPDRSSVWRDKLAALRSTGLSHLLAPLTDAAATASDGALFAQVADAFLALADCHPHGLRFGTFSLRSHAEAFFHWAQPAADYRKAFDKRLGKDRAVLEELVGRARDGVASAEGAGWRSAFNACMAEFDGQVANDDLDRAALPTGGPLRRVDGKSTFHAAVGASGVIDEPPAWFAAYRLTINLFYELLPALDISPIRRFYLCHAIAESVDAVFDETWQARLAAVRAHMAASP